jgi:7-cyano-7-deazaguanine synthase in queuosine biosynthesis
VSRLILFSGGVESTALLSQARHDDVLLTIQPTYPNDLATYRQGSAEQIAERYGLKMNFAGATVPLEPRPYRFVHKMRVFVSVANLWVAKDASITEVWCGRNAKEPGPSLAPFINQMMDAWDVLQPTVPFLHPLDHLSKREQWELIPQDVRPLVSTCMFHRMCGTCKKCLELTCLSESSPRVTSSAATQSIQP